MVASECVLPAGRVEGELCEWVNGFADELEGLAAKNESRPLSAGWAESVRRFRLRDRHFLNLLGVVHGMNPDARFPEVQRKFLSAEQAALMSAQDDGKLPVTYPSEEYYKPGVWQAAFRWVQNTPPYNNRYFDYLRRDLATSMSQRTVAVRFLSRVLSHLIGEEPQRASCGSGDMSGDKRNWWSGRDERFRFDPVRVREHTGFGRVAVSLAMSDIFNSIIGDPDDTRRVVCLDRVDPTEPANMAWIRACPTPEEIMSGEWADMHDALARQDVPEDQIAFRLADLTKKRDMEAVVGIEGVFDVASAVLSWYQGTSRHRASKLKGIFETLLGSKGVGIVADFATMSLDRKRLRVRSVWTTPSVFVGYEGNLYEVLSFSNGRFHDAEVLPDLALLARGGPYEPQVNELCR